MWGYCLPHGEDIKPAVEEIIKDAHERGQKPFIVMLTDAQRVKLETLFPSEFNYEFSPENQEYVYLSEDLINLSGENSTQSATIFQSLRTVIPITDLKK